MIPSGYDCSLFCGWFCSTEPSVHWLGEPACDSPSKGSCEQRDCHRPRSRLAYMPANVCCHAEDYQKFMGEIDFVTVSPEPPYGRCQPSAAV